MTFSYDIANTIGQVRFLCQDSDLTSTTGTDRSAWSCWFTDEEVTFAIGQTSTIQLAAAMLLRSLLSNKFFLQNTSRLGSWGADLATAISAIEKAIGQLEGGGEAYFTWAENSDTPSGERDIIHNDALRNED